MKTLVGMIAFGLVACSGKNSRVCEPGRQVACACPGGGSGAQACRANGGGYEPCRCEATPGGGTPSAKAPATDQATQAQPGAPGDAEAPRRRTAKDLVPCPPDAVDMAMRLTPVGEYDNGEPLEMESAKCTAGFFPDPGWVVVFRRGLAHERLVIDAASRMVLSRGEADATSGSAIVTVRRLATIDFDGDGTSEILHHYEYASGGYAVDLLQAFQVRGGALVNVFETPLASHNGGADVEPGPEASYKATYTLTKEGDGTRGIDVAGAMVAGSRTEAPENAVLGTARFRWARGRLTRQ